MNEQDSKPGERLRPAPGLLLCPLGERLEIVLGNRRHVVSIRALGILEQFSPAASMAAVVDSHRTGSDGEFERATHLIMTLRDEGVLVDARHEAHLDVDAFDVPSEHVSMLDDRARTEAFVRAIHAAVRPGDVVVDIGTGTGILARAAARAGARRVYAIEQGQIGGAAKRIFDANGVSDRVVLVHGHSGAVELPEKADLVVSETIGNDPLGEGIVATFRDARRRLLKPDGRVVPRAMDILALPVDLPEEFLSDASFTESNVARWRDAYDVDFRPLLEFAGRIADLPSVRPQDIAHWKTVAGPVRLAHVDLMVTDSVPTSSANFVATADAKNLGLVLFFDADLGPGNVLSTAPAGASSMGSWRCLVVRAVERPAVAAGEVVRVEFSGAAGRSDLRVVE